MPNKATANARQAIAAFVDGNSAKLMGWLEAIERQDGPQAAFKCFTDLLEYHVPKLSRTEQVGDGGGPVQNVHRVEYVSPNQNVSDTASKLGK